MFLSPIPDAYFLTLVVVILFPNFQLYHHNLPQDGTTFVSGTTKKFGNKMATTNVEKYASGTGERNRKISDYKIHEQVAICTYNTS